MAGENGVAAMKIGENQRGERNQWPGAISSACSESGNLKGYQRMKIEIHRRRRRENKSAAVAKISGNMKESVSAKA
jgi:hypothetical protein